MSHRISSKDPEVLPKIPYLILHQTRFSQALRDSTVRHFVVGYIILLKFLEKNPQPPSGRNYEFIVDIQLFPYHVPKFFNYTEKLIFII